MIKRACLDVVLLIGSFVAPLWLVLPAAIVCMFVFENFYEIIVLGIIIDALYGLPSRFFPFPIIYTISISVLFVARIFLKKHLRF